MLLTFDAISAAADRLRGAVLHTPTVDALALSAKLGLKVALKLETLQRTGSFKERGALNRLSLLTEAERQVGVIAASAGNHAQGLAYHGQRLGIPVTICMPAHTPFVKVAKTARYGANIVLIGADFSESEAAAHRLAKERGLTLVHPYDDLGVMAGQGTIGLEMLTDRPDLDTLVVPIGGGGLLAGIACAVKHLNPNCRLIGVQVEGFDAMRRVLAHEPPPLGGMTLAEGIAVKTPGQLTRAVINDLVDEIVTVDEDRIEQAVQIVAETQNLIAEGAGAAGVAALLTEPQHFVGKNVGTLLCGGNIDARLLSSILMRGLVRDGRLVRIRSELGDLPGTLARYSDVIGKAGGNIVEVHHQRMFLDVPIKQTEIDTMMEARGADHVRDILEALNEAGFPSRLLTD